VVAFEADDIDPVSNSGWSVTVTGCARQIHQSHMANLLRAMPRPRIPIERQHFVAIRIEPVFGSVSAKGACQSQARADHRAAAAAMPPPSCCRRAGVQPPPFDHSGRRQDASSAVRLAGHAVPVGETSVHARVVFTVEAHRLRTRRHVLTE